MSGREVRMGTGLLLKLLGLALVLVALSYAIDPNWPIALDQRRKNRPEQPMAPAPRVHSLEVVQTDGEQDATFVWGASFDSPWWHVVLLNAQRQVVAWSEPTKGRRYRPEGEFRQALAAGDGRFWYAVGRRGEEQVRSALCPVPPN